MRILILSYHFLPYAGMGATRVGRLAEFLARAGHDVRVVAARRSAEPTNQPLDPSAAVVSYTSWLDVNFVPDQASRLKNWAMGRSRRLAAAADSEPVAGGRSTGEHPALGTGGFLARLDGLYRAALNIPDDKIGWLPFALLGAARTARDFEPDIIYASSPPPTGLLAAAWLAHRLALPWVAEIRDRWTENPYDPRPPWRVSLDSWLERKVMSSASGIVTVSETWAAAYRDRYGKPTTTVYNGFMLADYAPAREGPAREGPAREDPAREDPADQSDSLRIVYTGIVYAGRDPSPLWQALSLMGAAAEGVRVEVYGAERSAILEGAARHGVAHLVQVRAYLSHGAAMKLQQAADVLLILQWNNPSEAGNIPGKLFEYLGARSS